MNISSLSKKIHSIKVTKQKILSIFVLFLLLFNFTSIVAQERGGYAGSFLRLGLGARSAAMGDAYIGMPGDVYSGYYNPAGLPEIKHREATFSYRLLSLDREFYFAGFAVHLPPVAGAAFGWIHAGINNIDGRDNNGIHTQTYSDDHNAFLFAFGLPVNQKISIGIGGTILREKLVGITAKGFGLNGGILLNPLKNLLFGAVVRDVGAHYSWDTSSLYEHGSSIKDSFPIVYSAGTSYLIEKLNTLAAIDIYKNEKSPPGYHIGIENRYYKDFAIRGGIDNGNFTAGFGILFPVSRGEASFNYAFKTTRYDPEISQIFSLNIIF